MVTQMGNTHWVVTWYRESLMTREEDGAARRRARMAVPVRHKPHHQSNAISDYIEQSLGGLSTRQTGSEGKEVKPKRRRKRLSRRPEAADESVEWRLSVHHAVETNELEDDDEVSELVAEFTVEYEQFGALKALEIDRVTAVVTVVYGDAAAARAAAAAKHGKVYGGRNLVVEIHEPLQERGPEKNEIRMVQAGISTVMKENKSRKRRSKIKNAVATANEKREAAIDCSERSVGFIVRHMVEPDEVEDEGEYEEVFDEIKGALAKFGELESVRIVRDIESGALETRAGDVVVTFARSEDAQTAFAKFEGMTYGSRHLHCHWIPKATSGNAISVEGMIAMEELEDDDEFADVQDEVESFFAKAAIGARSVELSRTSGSVTLSFGDSIEAAAAIAQLCTKTYGGRPLDVKMVRPEYSPSDSWHTRAEVAPQPKATVRLSDEVKGLLVAFLQRLAALQERAHTQNPLYDKRSRRLVLGLHEVRRGLIAHKIKLLIVAQELDACEVIDDKLSEILSVAAREEVPVIHGLTRRKLGRVLKKHARVSCVGVYSVDGANELFKRLLEEHKCKGRK